MVHDGVVSLVSCLRVWPGGMCVRGEGGRSEGGRGREEIESEEGGRREGREGGSQVVNWKEI